MAIPSLYTLQMVLIAELSYLWVGNHNDTFHIQIIMKPDAY